MVTFVSNLDYLFNEVFSTAELDDDVDLIASSDLKEGLITFKNLRICFKSSWLSIDSKSNLGLSYPLKLDQAIVETLQPTCIVLLESPFGIGVKPSCDNQPTYLLPR